MDSHNPYESPQSNLEGGDSTGSVGGAGISPKMIAELAGTKPWARLCSIMGFVGSAFMVLGGLAVMALGGFQGASGFAGGAAIGLVYIVLALLYIMPSLYLFRYASSIQKLLDARQTRDMEEALGHQRSFWKFVGVMILVMLAVYLIIIVGSIFFGVMSTGS